MPDVSGRGWALPCVECAGCSGLVRVGLNKAEEKRPLGVDPASYC